MSGVQSGTAAQSCKVVVLKLRTAVCSQREMEEMGTRLKQAEDDLQRATREVLFLSQFKNIYFAEM